MALIGEWIRRLDYLLRRGHHEEQLHREMEAHRAQLAEPTAFGNTLRLRDEARDAWGWTWLDDLVHDLRYALRTLRRTPGFTLTAIVTLALGIGVNTAMFSVLNMYLFQPLPYPHSEQLVQVHRTSIHSDSWPHSVANFLDLRQRNEVFEEMVAYNGMGPVLTREGQPAERLLGMVVSGNFFKALGVAPALGRVFTDDEDQPHTNNVVVLSDRFWRTHFGADPAIVAVRDWVLGLVPLLGP